jgi:hypothetical protein
MQRRYKEHLFAYTGTAVSESVVSPSFNHGFSISGRFRKPNLVPIDKFKPNNILRAQEYLMVLSTIDPMRVRFRDEKLVKGSKLFCHRTRRYVLTGEVLCVVTTSDFRNTYLIYGICGINPTTTQLYWHIHNGTNDSEEFAYDIERACALGYLQTGHILTLNNAIIHSSKDNKHLEEWLRR